MGGFADYDRYDAVGLAALVAAGDVSPAELLDEAIARTEKVNGTINAVTMRHYDEAKAAIDAGLPEGPLRGVPFLLKDLHLLLKGTKTTFGSGAFADNMADHDSTLTARYKQAGLVIFGKTNTPEFGLTGTTEPRLFGPTRNPWNTEHSPGGSSGGAAAAVAAGILPAANASDGGGSIRIPASCCGLFGMKPTRARTPMGPDRGEGWSGMSISHVVSRSVRDSAAILDATHGYEPGAPYACPAPDGPFLNEVGRAPGKLRIAFNTMAPNGAPTDRECVTAVEEAAKFCADLGHDVEEAAPPVDTEPLSQAIGAIIGANVALTLRLREEELGRSLGDNDLERWTQGLSARGAGLGAVDYAHSILTIHKLGFAMNAFHESYDVYLCPTLAQPPVKLGVLDTMTDDADTYMQRVLGFMPFTSMFNMTGQPSMSVPTHWTADGLPVGTMFTGRFGDEATLFRLAGQLEEARPWAERRAPVHAAA